MQHYDLIVKCDNLKDLSESGWPVVTKPGKFISENETQLKVVGISGCYNVGKSFVLNNLGAMNLPSSDTVHTEGLSVRSLNDNIALIDTAGTNTPIKVNNRQCLSDRICMEKILMNCLRELADFHICVVNKLTWQDQQHYEMLFNSINRTTKLWPLIIIHNFRDNTLSELKDLISEVQGCYPNGQVKANRIDISPQEVNQLFFKQIEDILKDYVTKLNQQHIEWLRLKFAQEPMVWFDSRGDDKCRHFFLVKNEGVGQVFNFRTFTHIKEIFATIIVPPRVFSIKSIRNVLDTYTRRYLRFENLGQIDDKIKSILEFVADIKAPNLPPNIVLHYFVLNKELRQHTIKLKDLYELEYHNLFLGATQWNPRYDILYKKNQECESCWVVIELPGEIKDDLDYVIEKDPNTNRIIITFSGQPIQEYIYSGKIIKGSPERHFTKFDFKVTIPGEYDADITNPTVGYEHGVYWIGLKKQIQRYSGKIIAKSN